MKTTLDLALIRWSVTHLAWNDLGAGNMPNLGAFLAGWFGRDAGLPMEAAAGITFIDSWRKGWTECDQQIGIIQQDEGRETHPLLEGKEASDA